jgi:hypothetical protein
VLSSQLLLPHEDIPDFSLVADRLLKPIKLFSAQGDGDGFSPQAPGLLITRSTLAGFVSLDQTAQSDPSDIGESCA